MAKYADSWLQLEAASGGRSALQGSVADIRRQFGDLLAALSPTYPAPSEGMQVTDGNVDGTRYRIYRPATATSTNTLPIGLFMHGGGFVLGDLDSEDMLCRTFSEQSNTILVSVDYCLAPEYKHPAQIEDVLTVLEWAYANASSFSGDMEQLYTIGTSAGATLALLAAREIVLGKINVPATALRGVIAVGPVTVHPEDIPMKYRAAHMSYAKLGEGAPVLTRSTMVGFLQAAGIAPDDASFFPLLDEESLSKFPPVYISTAECDPLRDDGRALVAAFRDAGVNVHEDLYEGLPHAFWFFNGLPQWQGFVRNIVAAIQWITVQKHLVDSD